VTVQSQLCGTLTFSSTILHTVLESIKEHYFKVGPIRARPVHRLNVFQLSFDVIGTLSYSKFEIVQLQREGSAAKSNQVVKCL